MDECEVSCHANGATPRPCAQLAGEQCLATCHVHTLRLGPYPNPKKKGMLHDMHRTIIDRLRTVTWTQSQSDHSSRHLHMPHAPTRHPQVTGRDVSGAARHLHVVAVLWGGAGVGDDRPALRTDHLSTRLHRLRPPPAARSAPQLRWSGAATGSYDFRRLRAEALSLALALTLHLNDSPHSTSWHQRLHQGGPFFVLGATPVKLLACKWRRKPLRHLCDTPCVRAYCLSACSRAHCRWVVGGRHPLPSSTVAAAWATWAIPSAAPATRCLPDAPQTASSCSWWQRGRGASPCVRCKSTAPTQSRRSHVPRVCSA